MRNRARDVGDLNDFRRHLARLGVVADLAAKSVAQRVVEGDAVAPMTEQDHPYIVLPVLANADALPHFRQLFGLAIDFGVPMRTTPGLRVVSEQEMMSVPPEIEHSKHAILHLATSNQSFPASTESQWRGWFSAR